MTFVPATDGGLHIIAGPGRTFDTPAASPFLRAAAPQPGMPVRSAAHLESHTAPRIRHSQ